MNRIIMAAAVALSPGFAFADHGHGDRDHAAHAAAQGVLIGSTPSDGAVLAEAPRSLALTFEHPVILQRLTVAGPSGPVNASFRPANSAEASYTVLLPAGLAAGSYSVRWTASGEGHEMSGTIRFVVQE